MLWVLFLIPSSIPVYAHHTNWHLLSADSEWLEWTQSPSGFFHPAHFLTELDNEDRLGTDTCGWLSTFRASHLSSCLELEQHHQRNSIVEFQSRIINLQISPVPQVGIYIESEWSIKDHYWIRNVRLRTHLRLRDLGFINKRKSLKRYNGWQLYLASALLPN